MEEYKSGKITAAECNKRLKESGSNLRVDQNKNPSGTWTKEEMEAGFTHAVTGREFYPAKPDMSRRKELAGKTVSQKTGIGTFDVTYNDLGYAVKALKHKK